jgi:hypothetical protein
MALLLTNGALFLHVPKTGGRWVASVLKEAGLVRREILPSHADLRCLYSPIHRNRRELLWFLLRRHFLGWGEKRFVFCFVRHPLSWYESWFRYMSQPSRRWRNWGDETDVLRWHPAAPLNGTGSDDFTTFVQNAIRKRPGFVTEMYGQYATSAVSFVGRQESLREDLKTALARSGLSIDEELLRESAPVNQSEKTAPLEWDPATRRRVEALEQAGMIRYGYATQPTG